MCLSRKIIREILYILFSKLGISSLTLLVTYLIIYVPFVIYCVALKRFPAIRSLILFSIVGILFFITYQFHPENAYWYDRENLGVFYTVFRPDNGALWAFFAIDILNDYDKIWEVLKIYYKILFLYCIFLAFQAITVNDGQWISYNAEGVLVTRSYDLEFGYNMAFCILVSLASFLQKKSKIDLIIIILGLYLELRFGSRGAFLSIGVFILLIALYSLKTTVQKFWGAFLSLVFIFFTTFFDVNLLLAFSQFLISKFNIESRTLQMMLTNSFNSDNGRDAIYQNVWNAIKEKPFLGYGPFGDRPIVGPIVFWGYSHNVILEMWIDFGIYIGSFILILLVIMSIRAWVNIRKGNQTYVITYFVLLALSAKLLISDSFWTYSYFWMFLAYVIKCLNIEKRSFKNIVKVSI